MQVNFNEQQQQVINHKGSPLLVIAGPGSGKTLVLVHRVKKLVDDGLKQSEILCLTFTEKAAGEMQTRLEQLGIVDAQVSTFHAFAKQVLEDNFLESGLSSDARIITRSSQMVWCMRNTDRFDFNKKYIVLGTNHVKVYSGILEAISTFKEEMVTPDDLQKYVDTKIKEDPEDIHIHRLHELNKVYTMYEAYLKEKGIIDFDDMVSGIVDLLKNNNAILAKYQKQFKHILVDEFQDNNYAQLEIAKKLATDGNITAVGDDDQCIMRFQGAYSGIFEDFQSHFPNFTKISLAQNYRCPQNIVKASKDLLESIPDREPKSLHSEIQKDQDIAVVRTPTELGQIEFIVKTIRDLVDAPYTKSDGSEISYRDIAILSRRRTEGQKFAKALKSHGIPTTFVGESNIFSTPIILELVSFLQIANSPLTAGRDIFKIMQRHGIRESNIAEINDMAHRKAREQYGKDEDYVLDTMRKYEQLDITQKTEIAELVEFIDKVIDAPKIYTISQLVFNMMTSISDLYKQSVFGQRAQDKKNRLILDKFYEIAEEFQNLNPEGSIGDFLEHLTILKTFEIDIEEGLDIDNAVHVMTMHKSKGKEYPIVFVTDLAERKFPTKYQEKMFHIPQDLMSGIKKTTDSAQQHEDEERRLFYVAMTRAQEKLFLLSPKKYSENVKESKPSIFLDEIHYLENDIIKKIDFEESDKIHLQSEELIERIKTDLQKEATSALHQMNLKSAIHRIIELARVQHYEKHHTLDKFNETDILKIDRNDLDLSTDIESPKSQLINPKTLTLSPSSVKAYGDCPLKFKLQKVLRVPQPAGKSTDLGTVIHAVVEELANKKASGQELTLETALAKLKEKWIFRSYQSKTDEGEATGRAQSMIEKYLEWEKSTQNTLVDTELSYTVDIHGIKFNGRIDRLEQNKDGDYEIVDFKTGKTAMSAKKAVADPQLNIYAKAIEKLKGKLPVKATLFYLEKKPVVYDITPESVQESMQSIQQVIQNILDEKFEPTPSFSACMFCPYTNICDAKVSEET